jgi:tellurite resistance protein TerC
MSIAYRTARRIVVGVIGATVILVGIALLVLPGPAFIVIPAGLAILALEFAWARRWLRVLRERSEAVINSFRRPKADLK